ncbi:hypothetical protein EDB81DRAFT_640180 [Dactylonectria macrodidyma]|uniref:Allergen n=1 Tax=Dactylonectria macrodidyma TaxID=307937 RepID=A0A9P9JJD9_9HYPO|nr:hypothetical protein EDB81DRAFT_640180 [Dactylonectria macrodidyma]
MEQAKQTIHDLTSRDGHHKTTINEEHREAVTNEHVRPHEHEHVTTAVDRDVHKDHHHTIVQPLTHTETLPEKHTYRTAPIEHRTIHHGNEKEHQEYLDRDTAQYKNTTTTHDTTHHTTTAPIISGERVHHHVHEHIQPVVEKHTIVPEVIHTTVPVHETHHVAPVHHETSVRAPKTLEEYTSGSGALHGRKETKLGQVEGCPQHGHPEDERSDIDAPQRTENTGVNGSNIKVGSYSASLSSHFLY